MYPASTYKFIKGKYLINTEQVETQLEFEIRE